MICRMTIMVMKLARLYLKIVTTDMKEITITTTMTTAITAATTIMAEMSIQNIMFRKKTATVKTMAASLSPHVLSPRALHGKRARLGRLVLQAL